MGVGLRLWLCFLFCFAILSSARNTISLSEDKVAMVVEAMEGRSLTMNLNDYNDASANSQHNPKTKGGGGGGRKTLD